MPFGQPGSFMRECIDFGRVDAQVFEDRISSSVRGV